MYIFANINMCECAYTPSARVVCTWRQPLLYRPRRRSANPSERSFLPPPRCNPGTFVKDIDPAAERARHAAASVVPARHHNTHAERFGTHHGRDVLLFIYYNYAIYNFTYDNNNNNNNSVYFTGLAIDNNI